MFKEFLIKKMLDKQLKDMPTEQKERIIRIVTENPELFQKIASEVQQKMKEGKDQMSAVTEVMRAHEDEMKKIL
ncbi:MAG: hypothetical protein COZ49_00020 [Candidatus Yonathbacteria bacterium CG_4_10_14_3_um_filter_47_65]|uniref:Uncharacterized protein n=2 Tax=Parcubacteria group TaxID=1794811 RepID=A0A2M8D8T8_9BACT|nr:MAG: hypothetical protein AUJ44_00160 [Candidatus Nomurabacteria bacterium CG1_02_47_685]PIP04195.1 MAG: hypothetical protein COX54_00325 [Candidatus Yonathbacteria bacterium CG23_combo_of_CG06-09_8_20_14_all_46_18]PIQ32391.1 MAG: hypothetical protein COW61_01750 [Candidatus Yonathbacteria bacterium CG17_big_fil_post_rev_8_21_14_2_50_46_19]PIX56815.1 MAG: hypothetical protein COZ49_00020 [Candidatus Yonathbacteria bacterium CG_4_10_14_3_um_filter_47_65]PIY57845.1 MAG: hypothetical protein CO